jgi:hypothetical protein
MEAQPLKYEMFGKLQLLIHINKDEDIPVVKLIIKWVKKELRDETNRFLRKKN